jgi:hypothetical protein
MSATVIAGDNLSTVLAQLSDRQDELAGQVDALAVLIADQAIRADEQDEQLLVQATALRATATQLSTNIREVAKAQGRAGAAAGGKGASGDPPPAAAKAAGDPPPAKGGPKVRLVEQAPDGKRGQARPDEKATVQPPASGKAEEPEPAQKRRAHRWI